MSEDKKPVELTEDELKDVAGGLEKKCLRPYRCGSFSKEDSDHSD